ncbi:MAG: sensor histidine kinase [Fusicatenibacter saccharivorans]
MACRVLSAEKGHHQSDAADSSDGSSDVGRLRSFFWLVVIMKFSGNMAHRLEKIKMTMSEVEEGNLEVELVSTERDEIGDLTRGFNQMLSRIRQLIQEVYESRIRQKQYEMIGAPRTD